MTGPLHLGDTSRMSSWRCARKVKKLGEIVVPAVAAAQGNPVPADLDDAPGLYLGDTMALALAYKVLFEGKLLVARRPLGLREDASGYRRCASSMA